MKVMISNDGPFAHYYIRMGLARVFQMMGNYVTIWDINKKSIFDAFDEIEPDFFIGQTFNLNESLIKCIQERPDMHVIMKTSDWGPLSDTLDRNRYPVLIASPQEIDLVMKLKELTGKPNFGYVHYGEHRLAETHGHWRQQGLKMESLVNAADIFEFTKGESKPEYECDLAFVGGRWGYKSQTLDRWFIPMCAPGVNLRIKIFGNQPWGVSQYCGFLQDSEVKHLFSSAKICPNLSEPHSQDFGYDIIERPFKLLANKCFVISDYVEDLHKLFPTEIVYGKTPEEFMEKIKVWLDRPDERRELAQAGHEVVMKNHTYFHRVRDILAELGLQDEVQKCDDAFLEVKERLAL